MRHFLPFSPHPGLDLFLPTGLSLTASTFSLIVIQIRVFFFFAPLGLKADLKHFINS